MRYLSSISLALVALMALACTATPAPTPDVPLLDEETVINLTIGFLYETRPVNYRAQQCFLHQQPTNAQYVGKDIWVVVIEPLATTCTSTVHDDKEARVILPQEDRTSG